MSHRSFPCVTSYARWSAVLFEWWRMAQRGCAGALVEPGSGQGAKTGVESGSATGPRRQWLNCRPWAAEPATHHNNPVRTSPAPCTNCYREQAVGPRQRPHHHDANTKLLHSESGVRLFTSFAYVIVPLKVPRRADDTISRAIAKIISQKTK